jgi:hypothetical protein
MSRKKYRKNDVKAGEAAASALKKPLQIVERALCCASS